jgi:hypothetical protein
MAFPQLDDYLAPQPVPAIMAVLMVLGMYYLSRGVSRAAGSQPSPPIEQAAVFILVMAMLAAAINFLSLIGAAHCWLLRIIAWTLLGLGILQIGQVKREPLSRLFNQIKGVFLAQRPWGRAALCLLAITGLGLFLSALGPPTDADSLDYHLGVPLDMLRHHGAYPRLDWFHTRLVGLGESLNMVGLAGGTDVLGAMLQFAGLILVLVAVISLARTDLDRTLVALGVLGCPVMLFLIPNQKPQMLPTAATTIAIILLAQRFDSLDLKTLFLAFGCTVFAVSCKYSFLFSGAIIVGVGLLAAYRAKRLGQALIIALAGYLILVFPVHLQNFLFYGDPLSPFLERFRTAGDAAVIRFAAKLQAYSDSQASLFSVPLNLFFPSSIGLIPTVLGMGPFLLFSTLGAMKVSVVARILLLGAALTILLTLFFGQTGARFFFEPYLWIVGAAGLAAWCPLKSFSFKVMVGQTALMAVLAVCGAATLFPGALTPAWRDRTMAKTAHGYAITRWLNRILPPDAVIVFHKIRASALMPRPFVSKDLIASSNLGNSIEVDNIISIGKMYHADTLITSYPLTDEINRAFGFRLGNKIAGPKKFHEASRNPWNRGEVVQFAAYRVHLAPKPLSKNTLSWP